jgi:hypothetical protein
MPDETPDPSNAVLAVSLSHLRQQMSTLGGAVADIGTSLKILTRLEESHSHVLEQLKTGSITMTQHEKRLQMLETKIGPLEELRKWVIAGLLGGLAMMGVALVKMVLVDPVANANKVSAAPPQVIYLQPPPAPSHRPAVPVQPAP